LGLPSPNPIQAGFAGDEDAFVVKLNKEGTDFEYTAYLGGGGFDEGRAIALDGQGNAYITGVTSGRFPLVGPFQPGSQDGVYLAKLNPQGTQLVYSFLLGARYRPELRNSDYFTAGTAIALDPAGNVYLAGNVSQTPLVTSPGAWQTTARPPNCASVHQACVDGFVAKVNPAGSAFVYLTYLSGGSADLLRGIAVDSEGNAYVAGTTFSSDLPASPGAIQPHKISTPDLPELSDQGSNGFIAKLNPSGSQLLYLTYFGRYLRINAIALDSDRKVYVTGTSHLSDMPLRPGDPVGLPPELSRERSYLFISKLDISSSAVLYTYRTLTQLQDAEGLSIAVTTTREAIVAGEAASVRFQLKPLQDRSSNSPRPCNLTTLETCYVQYVIRVNAEGTAATFATELGMAAYGGGRMSASGVALDPQGNAYVAGLGKLPHLLPSRLTEGTGTVVKIGFDSDAPSFVSESVVNAASFESGWTRGGALISIFGAGLTNAKGPVVAAGFPLPRKLAETEVLSRGQTYPLLAVIGGSAQQINAQIPYGGDPLYLGVIRDGKLGYAIYNRLNQKAGLWGVFEVRPGTPAVLHASDYQLVTDANPAIAGETILIFGTGFGGGSPPVGGLASGDAAPIDKVLHYSSQYEVRFGPLTTLSSFVGPAPGFAGVDQLNVVVPTGLPAGKIKLWIGDPELVNQQNLTVSIR